MHLDLCGLTSLSLFLFQTMCWLKFPKSQKLQICRMLLAMLQVWSITHFFFLMLFKQINRGSALSLPQSRVVLSAILWMETIPRGILFKACLFNLTFYKGSHSKWLKSRALYVHQIKTKHFIEKDFAQPFMVLQTFSKSMTTQL